MNPNSWFLKSELLEEFTKFCESYGWEVGTPQGEYEILRMYPKGRTTPLIVYRRKREMGYYTTFGVGKELGRQFMIERSKSK